MELIGGRRVFRCDARYGRRVAVENRRFGIIIAKGGRGCLRLQDDCHSRHLRKSVQIGLVVWRVVFKILNSELGLKCHHGTKLLPQERCGETAGVCLGW